MARGPAERRRQSSIAPMADLTRNAVDVLPEGRLEEQLAGGRPLRVKLGIDPTTADIHLGHTVVLEKLREFQEAGHTGRPDHRRLHRPGRRPERPLDPAAAALAGGDRGQRGHLPGAGLQGPRPRADRGPLQQRVAARWSREALLGLLAQTTVARLLERDDFQKRLAAERADRGARAALPAAAGLRLGRGRGRRRAGGDRPEVQPALRPRHPGRLRPGAAVDPDDADPGRHRRRPEDEQVARQLRRRHRPAGGDVRAADADPRRGDGRVLPAAARRGAAGGRGAERGEAGAGPADRRALPRRRRRPTAAEEHFNRLFVERRGARGDRGARPRAATPARTACSSTCRC